MRVKMSVNLNLINVGSNQQHRKEEGWKEGRRAAARLDTRPLSVKTLACATFKRGLISGPENWASLVSKSGDVM